MVAFDQFIGTITSLNTLEQTALDRLNALPDSPASSLVDSTGLAGESSIKIINESLRKRKANERDNITQMLRAGRELAQIKRTLAHGSWQQWVLDNTDYELVRDYQNDMQFWETWKDYIDDLLQVGMIHDLDGDDSGSPVTVSNASISRISPSAMEKFMRDGVPHSAFQTVIEALHRGPVKIKDATAIIDTAKRIENLPDEYQETATQLHRDYGLTNPQVIEMIPQIMGNEEMLEEIQATGTLYVPGLDRQIPLSDAGPSDVQLALGRYEIEQELSKQDYHRGMIADKMETQTQFAQFDKVNTIEGTLQQVVFELNKQPTNTIYRVVVYARKKD